MHNTTPWTARYLNAAQQSIRALLHDIISDARSMRLTEVKSIPISVECVCSFFSLLPVFKSDCPSSQTLRLLWISLSKHSVLFAVRKNALFLKHNSNISILGLNSNEISRRENSFQNFIYIHLGFSENSLGRKVFFPSRSRMKKKKHFKFK